MAYQHQNDAVGGVSAWISSVVADIGRSFATRRDRARKAWVRHVTEVEISRLPPEVRKDIGWPTRHFD
jgi:hypothetical protein